MLLGLLKGWVVEFEESDRVPTTSTPGRRPGVEMSLSRIRDDDLGRKNCELKITCVPGQGDATVLA